MQLAVSAARFELATLGDEALVGMARNGDEGAVRTLIARYNQRLFRTARGVVRDDAEAEDVVQEAYVRAFTSLHSFRGEAQLSTWLTRIALNEALGRVRRRRPMAELAELDASPNEGRLIMFPSSLMPASPETETARGQVRDVIEAAVDRLPELFRITKKVAPDSIPTSGLEFVLSGRLEEGKDGRVISCTASPDGGRPDCTIAVSLESARLQDPDTGDELASWGD